MPHRVIGKRLVETDLLVRPVAHHDLAAAADDGVSALELGAEPRDVGRIAILSRRKLLAADGPEPQRDFGKIRRGRIEVDAEDVVIGDDHLHAGLLRRVLLDRDGLLEFLLLLAKVDVRELIDGLVQERRGSHRRFADRELHHLVRGHVVRHALLDGEPHQTARQHFRRVVRGRTFAVSSRHAVDE